VSERNLEIVQRAWDAWGVKDMDRLVEDWDADIEWDLTNFAEATPEARFRGVAQVMTLIANWMSAWATYEATVVVRIASYSDLDEGRRVAGVI